MTRPPTSQRGPARVSHSLAKRIINVINWPSLLPCSSPVVCRVTANPCREALRQQASHRGKQKQKQKGSRSSSSSSSASACSSSSSSYTNVRSEAMRAQVENVETPSLLIGLYEGKRSLTSASPASPLPLPLPLRLSQTIESAPSPKDKRRWAEYSLAP